MRARGLQAGGCGDPGQRRGSLANLAWLARNIAQAVRDALGGQLAIIAKLNMDDGVPGGFWLDESIQVAQ